MRLTAAVGWFTGAVTDMVSDSKEVLSMAEETFGLEDWKDYPMLKEHWDTATKGKEQLTAQVQAFADEVDSG